MMRISIAVAAVAATLVVSDSIAATLPSWIGTADYTAGTYGDAVDGSVVGPFSAYDVGVGAVLVKSNSGSGTPVAPVSGDVYDGYLQSYIQGHNLGGSVDSGNLNTTGSGSGYELTVMAQFQELITSVDTMSGDVDFDVTGGTFDLYLDDTPDYDFGADTGFGDNGAILSGNIVGGSGTFLGGIALGVSSIDVLVTSYDTAVFDPDTISAGTSVFTLQLAPGDTAVLDQIAAGANSVSSQSLNVAAGDLLFSADGNFALAAVPVPAAVWLFGGALGLLGTFVRRRS